MESSPSGLIMVDRDGRVVLVNREIERLFGYPREELLGQSIELLIPERFGDSHPDFRSGFIGAPSVRSMGAGRDLFGRRKDGSEIPLEIGLTPVATEEGLLVLAAVVDISERKASEVQRRALEEQLRHSQKMQAVGTLAGGIAHDFNNILAAIATYAELIRDAPVPHEQRDDAETILEACRRGKTLVERILTFGRRREIELRPVSLGEVFRSTETLLRATIPSTVNIEVITRGGDRLMADPNSLEQVILNVATNAAQAMPDGGTMRVTIEPLYLTDSKARAHPSLGEGQYVSLTVEDSGSGIDAEHIGRVFEPFFTTKEAGSGTGLGLSLVDSIVADHGGAASIESERGAGTRVRCLFPALDTEWLGGQDAHSDARPIKRGDGENVLLLEDEPALAIAVERRLRALGYEVRAFTRARTAVQVFSEDPDGFDLVLTDFTMPEMNGLEAARRIVTLRPGIPIVMVTGFPDDLDPERLEASGVVRVLKKPTTVEEMASELRSVLDQHGARRGEPGP